LVIFISAVLLVFALVRAVGVTAAFPWAQEYVPNSVRGKYTANSSVFTTIAALISISAASFVIGRSSGISGFMVLIAVGLGFGLLSVWLASFIPGGAPDPTASEEGGSFRALLNAAHDKTLWLYLGGVGLVTLANTPIASFLPLYMQEQIGLSQGNIVLLQNGSLIGGLMSTYLWGWASDRYGSKPVMISGILFRLLLPVAWFLMPRHSELSLYVALGIAMMQGISDMGWAIGSGRILYVSVVPPEKKGEYMSLYYAFIGIVGGTSQLVGGQILALSQGIDGQFMSIALDQYTTLFVMGLVLLIISLFLLGAIRTKDEVSVREFAGMFLQGNPLLAMESVIRYSQARDERSMVTMTEMLGAAKSPLTVDELLEALADPRFNVRFEAIISIARTKSDPRLVRALRNVLEGSELSLSVVAAWALGRLGDVRALKSLRDGLNSDYRSIRAHCARALGTIGDRQVIPIFMERLKAEPDKGLQMAYASTLGKLQTKEAAPLLLDVLEDTRNHGARLELVLALVRIVGDEGSYIRLVPNWASQQINPSGHSSE
jgi:predicted MFS family arabinose efflux permease